MKRILFNWYYHRFDLTEYLLTLSDEFELVFIYKHTKPEITGFTEWKEKNVSVIYWGDYKSPYQLLSVVQPDLVVFYDIEMFNQIALNVAARNKGIPTYVLQHGVRGAYEVKEALSYSEKQPIIKSDTSVWSVKFFFSAFRFRNFRNFFSMLNFIILRKRNELTVALNKSKAEWRNADYYIEISKNNTGYHKERDGIPDDRFIIIGNPQFDAYFKKLNNATGQATESYCLLIDCPFCEAVFLGTKRMSIEEKNCYLKNISGWCSKRGLKLFVKLHPLSFSVDYLIKDENIVYFKEADITDLVIKATTVFFVHFSSLTSLIMHYKPFIILASNYLPANDFLSKKGIQVINTNDFNPDMNIEPNSPLTAANVEDVLYKTDGKAVERLRSILKSAVFAPVLV